ncbi:hypothetical protein O181_109937 [Austropuccinia psidii MF-1]|uniref:Retroviral polymerase SH3-like domain-containing protein n=1 Tax=Austropuccinia psidii MF-1 TaxID=1389203 RepID=A0A9Q3JX26_9BASI|nr:hypothetical protein [Austropuccinia psidii MF-1]
MIPTASQNNLSPYYLWKNISPKIKILQTFGCKVIFSVPKHQPKWKLAPPGEIGILLGYENDNSAYRILKIRNKKVYTSRNVTFLENEIQKLVQEPESDPCSLHFSNDPFEFYERGRDPIWLFLHIDDIGVLGDNLSLFKQEIEEEFSTKILGFADLMLEIKISHLSDSINFSQAHYVDSVLELYGMTNCRPTATPMVPHLHLEEAADSERKEFLKLNSNYHSAIRSLSCLSTLTQSYLAYAVSTLSKFLEKPGITNWRSFLHASQYLKGNPNIQITYKKSITKPLEAYSDANWGSCQTTRSLVTGYIVTLNRGIIIWRTCKQPNVSLSLSEAEYRALTDLTKELLWI